MDTTELRLIEAFANAHGLDTTTAIALMAVVNRGISTSEDVIADFLGGQPLPPSHLGMVEHSGSTGVFMGRILAPALNIQRLIAERFGRVDPKLLRAVWKRGGDLTLGRGVENDTEARQIDAQQELVFGSGPSMIDASHEALGSLELAEVTGYSRIDLALRSRFIVENVSPGGLLRDLNCCNRASGLFTGGRGLSVEGLRGKALAEVIDVMDGVRLPVPEMLRGGSDKVTEPSCGTLILEGRESAWMEPGLNVILDRVILMKPELRNVPADLDFQLTTKFADLWAKHIRWLIDRRRWGTGSVVEICGDKRTAIRFTQLELEFAIRCQEAMISNPSLRGLPRVVAALLMSMIDRGDSSALLDEVFRHSELILERHQAIARRLKGEAETVRLIAKARKLHDRIKQLTRMDPSGAWVPVTFRDLVRGFDVQRKEVHMPVLELMMQAGLILEMGDGCFVIGSEEDVEGAFRKVIAEQRFKLVA